MRGSGRVPPPSFFLRSIWRIMELPMPVLLVAALSLLPSDVSAFCEQSSVSVGFLFNCQIGWEDFYESEQPPSSGVVVQYSVSLDSAAGLPSWLTLLQSDSQDAATAQAFLYGTPEEDDIGQTTLNAFLTRSDTLEKRSREITISIQKPEGNILRVSEFFITNYSVGEFLNANVITRFEGTLSMVFQQEGAAVTKIINPLERGILVPPPPEKHGVIVQSTPGLNVAAVSMAPSEAASLVQGNCDPSDSFNTPPLNFELFALDRFDINWCQYVMYTFSSREEATGGLAAATVETEPVENLAQPSAGGSYISLVVVMALGFVLIIMVVSGLAMVFCGRRKASLSQQQRHRRHTIKHHIEEDSRGPASAQKHLRDLARSLPPSATNPRMGEERDQELATPEINGEEGGLLEFQDVTDYGNRHGRSRDEQTPPTPDYTYDEELLSRPLYEPGKRYRLITI